MKLQHLEIGARFEYEGEIFVKTGPITAAGEKTGQRVIPRSAVLKPLDLAPQEPGKAGLRRKLDEKTVRNAFDTFYQAAAELLDESRLPQLAAARKHFLAAIK